MKNKISRNLLVVLAFVVAGLSMTSCNKGYGCPTDFSVAEKVVETAANAIIDQIK